LDNSPSARGRLDIDQLRLRRRRSLEDEPRRFPAEIDDEQLVRPERNVAFTLIVESSARAVSPRAMPVGTSQWASLALPKLKTLLP